MNIYNFTIDVINICDFKKLVINNLETFSKISENFTNYKTILDNNIDIQFIYIYSYKICLLTRLLVICNISEDQKIELFMSCTILNSLLAKPQNIQILESNYYLKKLICIWVPILNLLD